MPLAGGTRGRRLGGAIALAIVMALGMLVVAPTASAQ